MLRFGIVGTGRISDWVLKGAVQDPRFKATAVCSRSADSAEAFIRKHPEAISPDASIFTSIGEMAHSGAVDAVYIGTPNHTHCPYTVEALKAGVHVLCEKPLACNADEVRQMIRASSESGKCLMEAMISTLNPNFRAARGKIGDLGKIRHYSSSYCQYSSKYEALRQGIVSNSFNPQSGGGALADIGVYTTFPLTALFGRPLSVKSNVIKYPTAFGDTDIQGSMLLEYPGMTASLAYSKVVDSKLPTEICGENGNILLDAVHICRKASFAPHQAPSSGRGPESAVQIISEGLPKDEYFYEFEEFINTVEAGKTESEINSHEISLINREIMDMI